MLDSAGGSVRCVCHGSPFCKKAYAVSVYPNTEGVGFWEGAAVPKPPLLLARLMKPLQEVEDDLIELLWLLHIGHMRAPCHDHLPYFRNRADHHVSRAQDFGMVELARDDQRRNMNFAQ